MEDQGLCCWCARRYIRNRAVPPLANEDETGCLVFEHGHVGIDRAVLCYEYLPIDTLWYHYVCSPSGFMAIPKSLRRRWVLRQLPARLGLARGTSGDVPIIWK